jgi:hypothetical protein
MRVAVVGAGIGGLAVAVDAVAQARGRVAGPLRDAVLRLVPARLVARPLLDLQAWRPPAGAGGDEERVAPPS